MIALRCPKSYSSRELQIIQLRKARVTNFKIVEDSTEFTLDRVTCLVGKNESGKTALLEALYRLSPYYKEDAKYDKVEEYPRRYFSDYAERHPNGDAPVISTTWELEDADVTAVEAVLGPNALKSREVVIHKGYDETGTTWNVPVDEKSVLAHLIAQAELHMEEAEPASQHKTVADLKKYLEAKALQISDREQKIALAIDKFRDGSVFKAAIDALRLPKFVSFSDYDYMSGNVAIDDLLRRKGTNDPKQIKPGEKVFFCFSWSCRNHT
jgi:predicted ATP-dependent endonuclease of OLD family